MSFGVNLTNFKKAQFATCSTSRSTRGVLVVRQAKAGNWCPGSESPVWLDGSIPGDLGFDPFGWGKDPERLNSYRANELMNGRWAMLAIVGMIVPEALGYGDWYNAPSWGFVNGSGTPTYLGIQLPFDLATVSLIEVILMGTAEFLRGGETDAVKKLYPGEAFDPLGLSKDAAALEAKKNGELLNGRLAMFAVLGVFSQHSATVKGPFQNLVDHVSDPAGVNLGTNGISLPFL